MAGIAIAAALSAVLYSTISGPMSSMVRISNKTQAKAQMQSIASIIIMDAINNMPNNGDCTGAGTGFVVPRSWKPGTGPTGGGILPTTIGAPLTDPWGTNYGYCVWEVGVASKAAACDIVNGADQSCTGINGSNSCSGGVGSGYNAARLLGSINPTVGSATSQIVIAIISAGPNRTFNSTCSAYVNTSSTLVTPGGDDIVVSYTYQQAATATSSLWTLSPSSAATAVISKDISVGTTLGTVPAAVSSAYSNGIINGAAVVAEGEITSTAGAIGLANVTGASTQLSSGNCNSSSEYGQMYYNTTTNAVDVCTNAGWTALGGGGSGSSALNTITAAVADGTLQDSVAHPIIWNWNSLAGGNGLTLGSTSTAAASNTQTLLNIALSGTNGASGQTTYAEQIANTHGGTGTNVALSATASGGTNNYAAIFNAGNVGIGTTAPDEPLTISANTTGLPAGGAGILEHLVAADGGSGGSVMFDTFAGVPSIQFRRADGTAGSLSAVQLNDSLGGIAAKGYGATGYSSSKRAGISFFATENWSDTAQGAYMTFSTTAATTVSPLERMRIDNLGNVGIGTAAPGGTLAVVSTDATGATTSAATSISANSLTTGTGLYAASSSLTSGYLEDLEVSGTAAAASQTALNILTTGATATNAITTYGAQISNTHTNATSGTNVGLSASASGATTENYGVYGSATGTGTGIYGINTSSGFGGYFTSSSGYALITGTGNVGIGTAAPGGTLAVVSTDATGATTSAATSISANSLTTGTGLYAASSSLTSGKLEDLEVSGTAAAASQTGLNILTTGANGTAGITTYGAQISNTHSTNTSTNVGLYLNASGGATANYGLIVNAGNVGIGTTTPGALFTVGSNTFEVNSGGTVLAGTWNGSAINLASYATGILPVLNGGTGVTTSTGTGSVVLSASPTLTGTLTAGTFSGSGASLTSLNASNLSSGTVPTARLGSGTASSSTYLRGDQTWASVSSGLSSCRVCEYYCSVGGAYGCNGYSWGCTAYSSGNTEQTFQPSFSPAVGVAIQCQ